MSVSGNQRLTNGLIVAVLIVVSLACRTPIALRESLWYDECLTRQVVLTPWGDWWDAFTATESSPPLYFAATKLASQAFDVFRPSPPAWFLSLRWLSILAATITPIVFFFGTRRFIGQFGASVAALYLAINPLLSWYAAEARPYALLTLLVTGLLVLLIRLVQIQPASASESGSSSIRLAVAYAACSIAAVWTHYFAIVVVAVAAISWAIAIRFQNQPRNAWKHWLNAHAVIGVAAIPLLFLLRYQASFDHTSYIPPATLQDFGRAWLVAIPFGLDAALFPAIRIFGALCVCGVLGIVFLSLIQRNGKSLRPLAAVSLGWFLGIVLLLFAISAAIRPVFLYDRYPIMALPALALMVGICTMMAFSAQRSTIVRLAAGVCVSGLLFCSVWQSVRYVAPGRGSLRYDWLELGEKLTELGYDPVDIPAVEGNDIVIRPYRHNLRPKMSGGPSRPGAMEITSSTQATEWCFIISSPHHNTPIIDREMGFHMGPPQELYADDNVIVRVAPIEHLGLLDTRPPELPTP